MKYLVFLFFMCVSVRVSVSMCGFKYRSLYASAIPPIFSTVNRA